MNKEELRKELFDLRLKLQMLKMEKVSSDQRVVEVEKRIKEVRREFAKCALAERKEDERGKKV